MFGQFQLWTDCDRSCCFCSQEDCRTGTDTDGRRRRIMKACRTINSDGNRYDRIGIIGGELFCWQDLKYEWRCLAEVLSASSANVVFVATHLMLDDLSGLIDFISYVSKEVVICTSYDTVGRFTTEEDYNLWLSNATKLHEMGYKICCTCVITEEFVTSEPRVPEWMEISLVEPIPSCYFWAFEYVPVRPDDEHECLMERMAVKHLTMPKRNDTLKWLGAHKDIAEHYADYLGQHSEDIWEYRDGDFVKTYDDRFTKQVASCGHLHSARCYADSPRCLQCDIKEMFEW